MKDRPDAILRPAQAAYLDGLLPPRDPVRRKMEERAAAEGIPIADPELGRLLEILARSAASDGAGRLLEIGTAIGYGALSLALGAPEARIVTIDRDGAMLAAARQLLEEAGVLGRVELVEGEAVELMPTLEGPWDLVFIDGDKRDYRRCLDLSLQGLRVGGLVVVDNLLWKGEIAEPPEDGGDDEAARAVEAFNPYFMIHPQLRSLLLPLGDGVGLGTKIQPLVTDMGGPF